MSSMLSTADPEKLYVDVDEFVEICINGWLEEEKHITGLLGKLLVPYIHPESGEEGGGGGDGGPTAAAREKEEDGGAGGPDAAARSGPPSPDGTSGGGGGSGGGGAQRRRRDSSSVAKPRLVYREAPSERLQQAADLAEFQQLQLSEDPSPKASLSMASPLLPEMVVRRQNSRGSGQGNDGASVGTKEDNELSTVNNNIDKSRGNESLISAMTMMKTADEDEPAIDWVKMKKNAIKTNLVKHRFRAHDGVKLARKMGLFMREMEDAPFKWKKWSWLEEWEWGGLLVHHNSEDAFDEAALAELGDSSSCASSASEGQGGGRRRHRGANEGGGGGDENDDDDKSEQFQIEDHVTVGHATPYGFDVLSPTNGASRRGSAVLSRHGSFLGVRNQDHLRRALERTRDLATSGGTQKLTRHESIQQLDPLSDYQNQSRRPSVGDVLSLQPHLQPRTPSGATPWKSTADLAWEQQQRAGSPPGGQLPPASPIIGRQLNLAHYGVGDENARHLATELEGAGVHVQALNLAGNKLGEAATAAVLRAVADHPAVRLRRLDVASCRLGAAGIDSLRRIILDDRCQLQELVLDNTNLTDKKADAILSAVAENRTISSLSLRENKIQAKSKYLAEMLSKNFKLESLELSWNQIQPPEADRALRALERSNTTLRRLGLGHNPAFAAGVVRLGRTLMVENSMLNEVDASYTGIMENSVPLLEKIIQRSALTFLDISGNSLGPGGAERLEEAARDLESVTAGVRSMKLNTGGPAASLFLGTRDTRKKEMDALYAKYSFTPMVKEDADAGGKTAKAKKKGGTKKGAAATKKKKK